jgi:hypothetical protein
MRRNPLQYTGIRGSSRPRKFLKVALSCTPEESSELEVRQETAAGLQPAGRWSQRFAKIAYSGPDIAQQADAAQAIHGTFLA